MSRTAGSSRGISNLGRNRDRRGVNALPIPPSSPPGWPPAWLAEPATRALVAAFAAAGIAIRFVGGAVRDALLARPELEHPGLEHSGLEHPGLEHPGRERGDVDLATPARPEAVIAALGKAGIKAVPTGLAHGTVTAVFPDEQPPRHFEITTLRRDVATDGRHAIVAFDADWGADAARRDFTINAIYLDPDGTIHDPVGGRADLAARHVRFVGDAATRIAEDVLRLLRYYRFEASFGDGAGDPAARAACRDAVDRLPTLSAERVAHELVELLIAAEPIRALAMMRDDGVLAAILPEADRIDRLERLIALAPDSDRGPDPLRRLAALVAADRDGADRLARRLRFSTAWRERLVRLMPPWEIDPAAGAPAQRRSLYRLGAEAYRDLVLLMAADGGIPVGRVDELLDLASHWTPPVFPIGGDDATALGIAPGPRIGEMLEAVRQWWAEGDFTASRDQCLERLGLERLAGIAGQRTERPRS